VEVLVSMSAASRVLHDHRLWHGSSALWHGSLTRTHRLLAGATTGRLLARGIIGFGVTAVAYLACAATGVAQSTTPHQPAASRPAFACENLSAEDLDFIVNTARRVVHAVWSGRQPESTYAPPSLRGIKTRVSVTLRHRGRVIGQADSGEEDLMRAVNGAASLAVRRVPREMLADPNNAFRAGLEVELVGPPRYLSFGLDDEFHHDTRLFSAFEPGVDGVGVELHGRAGRARPSVILASNYTPNLALQHAEKEAGFAADTKERSRHAIRYFSFRTVHLWQQDAGSKPQRLVRGVTIVPTGAVAEREIDQAIRDLLDHVRKRRRRDAWFAYEFVPGSEEFSDVNLLFGQFAAAWGLGSFGQLLDSPADVESASRVFAAAQSFVQPIASERRARAVVVLSELEVPLATTGMYLSGIVRFGSPEIKLPPAEIADAIRIVQADNGRFDTVFPPEPAVEGNAFAAAVAMRGLLDYRGDRDDELVAGALRRGLRFYRNYFRHLPDRALAAWMTQTLAAAYRRKPDPEVSDSLFEMADWLVSRQINADWTAAPELIGGVVDRTSNTADASTAVCLLAFADAHWMADRLGDRERLIRYAQAMRLAARFVMQLQFRSAECFYVGSPQDVVGAVRASLWDHRLRVDDSALALWALTRAREQLYGPPPRDVLTPASRPAK